MGVARGWGGGVRIRLSEVEEISKIDQPGMFVRVPRVMEVFLIWKKLMTLRLSFMLIQINVQN